MLHGRKTSLILICLLTSFVAGAAADDSRVFTAEDFLQGRVPRCSPKSEPTTLLIQISPRLAPYRFKLIPEASPSADGNIRQVGRIQISRPGIGAVLQTIEVRSNWSDSVCRLFDATDVNFDGYLDISVVREGAATWASRDYYLFDPKSGRFITNDLTHDLDQLKDNGLSLDWKTHQIQAAFLFSLCGGMDIYRIEDGRLIKIQQDNVVIDPDSNQCVETVRRWDNGEWKVVRVETKKIPRLDSMKP